MVSISNCVVSKIKFAVVCYSSMRQWGSILHQSLSIWQEAKRTYALNRQQFGIWFHFTSKFLNICGRKFKFPFENKTFGPKQNLLWSPISVFPSSWKYYILPLSRTECVLFTYVLRVLAVYLRQLYTDCNLWSARPQTSRSYSNNDHKRVYPTRVWYDAFLVNVGRTAGKRT